MTRGAAAGPQLPHSDQTQSESARLRPPRVACIQNRVTQIVNNAATEFEASISLHSAEFRSLSPARSPCEWQRRSGGAHAEIRRERNGDLNDPAYLRRWMRPFFFFNSPPRLATQLGSKSTMKRYQMLGVSTFAIYICDDSVIDF